MPDQALRFLERQALAGDETAWPGLEKAYHRTGAVEACQERLEAHIGRAIACPWCLIRDRLEAADGRERPACRRCDGTDLYAPELRFTKALIAHDLRDIREGRRTGAIEAVSLHGTGFGPSEAAARPARPHIVCMTSRAFMIASADATDWVGAQILLKWRTWQGDQRQGDHPSSDATRRLRRLGAEELPVPLVMIWSGANLPRALSCTCGDGHVLSDHIVQDNRDTACCKCSCIMWTPITGAVTELGDSGTVADLAAMQRRA